MNSFKSIFFCCFFILLFSNCESDNRYSKSDLIGNWNCVILQQGSEKEVVKDGEITFSFEENSYDYKGFAYRESGEWHIDGPFLVTTMKGGKEKKAEINRISGDTLVLDMVDNGVMMQFYLLKD
ncbi:MAG: hypothetical protein HKN22_03985 [Bacteroidia bacterium]|nr:hypothetical protein [Bacteroidia bacterium]